MYPTTPGLPCVDTPPEIKGRRGVHPSDVVLIGRIFIGFYYRRGRKAVTITEQLTGEISPAHLVIHGLDTSAKLPPPYPC